MLKRLIVIAILTGIGQLFSVFVIKWVSQITSSSDLAQLAQYESLFQLLVNIIALGLQSSAIRNIALQKDWKDEYARTQSARMVMALLILPISIVSYYNTGYLVFLMAPLLSLSGDYALYALGFSVTGAGISLLRTAIPYSLVLLAGFFIHQQVNGYYLSGLILAYIVTDLLIAKKLDVHMVFKPQWRDFLLYFKTIRLGLVNLSFYILGLGMMLVIPYFYPVTIVPLVFVGLKFYMIFKWVIRMIHQSFLNEMKSDSICLKVDQLCSLIGFCFAVSVIAFPHSFIILFFGSEQTGSIPFFVLLASSALVFSLFSSFTTKALYENRDRSYAKVAVICSLFALILPILFSFITKNIMVIGASLFLSELLFTILMIVFISSRRYLRERLLFYRNNLTFLVIPILMRLFFNDNFLVFSAATVILILSMGLVYYRKFLNI